jgi:hypothetical protein
MADVKISALPAATTPVAGTEVLPIVQSGTTKKLTIADVTAGRAMSASSLTLTSPLGVASGGTGISSFGAGIATFLGTPSSANLAAAVTDETGTGALVFGTSPTFTTSAIFPAGTVGAPSITTTGDTNTGIYFPAADTIGFVEGGVESARIDSSGTFRVKGAGTAGSTDAFLVDGAAPASAARIDSSGNLLVGTTSSSPGISNTTVGIALSATFIAASRNDDYSYFANRNNSDGGLFWFGRQGSFIGSISITTTAVAYNQTSDISLKENIAEAPSALQSILSMPVRQFDWKSNGSHTDYGVVAQEVNEYAPEIVTQSDLWCVDYGRITPRLIKAFQELAAKVSALEAKQ